MREVSSEALVSVNRALGLAGAGGSPVTEFAEGMLDQTLVVNPFVRRGRAPGTHDGIFQGAWQNTHAAGPNTVTTSYDLYGLIPGTNATPPWPNSDAMQGLDVWILNLWAYTAAVGANFGGARFDFLPPEIPNFGSLSQAANVLVRWDVELTVSGTIVLVEAGTDQTTIRGPWRVPRGHTARFTTDTSGAGLSDYVLYAMIGLFPMGLGQDAL